MKTHAFWQPAPSKRDHARLRLLEAAVEVFGEKGLDRATVRDIATAAGQNVAAIAYYFGGKEKLYHAMLEGIVREIRHRLGDVLEQVGQLREAREKRPEEAIRLLKLFLQAVYSRLLSRNEMVPIARVITREQLAPTQAFEILYEQGFRQLHEALCFLVGAALGRNPRDREIILRTHAVMGQVYFFAMAREAVLRRLNWTTLEGRNAEIVAQILDEHIDVLLSGLAQKTNPALRSP
jgi:AcrR family transcriptional regulator